MTKSNSPKLSVTTERCEKGFVTRVVIIVVVVTEACNVTNDVILNVAKA